MMLPRHFYKVFTSTNFLKSFETPLQPKSNNKFIMIKLALKIIIIFKKTYKKCVIHIIFSKCSKLINLHAISAITLKLNCQHSRPHSPSIPPQPNILMGPKKGFRVQLLHFGEVTEPAESTEPDGSLE